MDNFEEVRNEDLVVGDMVKLWAGIGRVVRIEPYRGPLTDIVFAIAECEPSTVSHSLEIGGYTTIVKRAP